MKKFSKVLAVALAVLMLMMTSITAFADHALLPLNEVIIVNQIGGDLDEFNFETEKEGFYVIHTQTYDDVTDPYVRVYYYEDDTEVEVTYADDSILGNLNCDAVFYAEPGKLYYIEISNWNSEDVEFEVMLETWNNDYAHWYHHDNDSDAICDVCLYEYCDHSCHDNGFFWRITNFFNRLFRINRFCECGIYHW